MKFIVFICKQNFATNEDHPTSLKEQDCLSNVYCRDACTSLNEIVFEIKMEFCYKHAKELIPFMCTVNCYYLFHFISPLFWGVENS